MGMGMGQQGRGQPGQYSQPMHPGQMDPNGMTRMGNGGYGRPMEGAQYQQMQQMQGGMQGINNMQQQQPGMNQGYTMGLPMQQGYPGQGGGYQTGGQGPRGGGGGMQGMGIGQGDMRSPGQMGAINKGPMNGRGGPMGGMNQGFGGNGMDSFNSADFPSINGGVMMGQNLGQNGGLGQYPGMPRMAPPPPKPEFNMDEEDFPTLGGPTKKRGGSVSGSGAPSPAGPQGTSMNGMGGVPQQNLPGQQQGTHLQQKTSIMDNAQHQPTSQLQQQLDNRGQGGGGNQRVSVNRNTFNASTTFTQQRTQDVRNAGRSQQQMRVSQDVRGGSQSRLQSSQDVRSGAHQGKSSRGNSVVNNTVGRSGPAQTPPPSLVQNQNQQQMKDVKDTLKNIGRGGGGATAMSGGSESRYGILGLLDIIRMTNPFMNVLALGQDLTAMGLNMNSTESLYSQFSSPWSDEAPTTHPPYQTPQCYMLQPPALKAGHLKKFDIQSLFYVFYAMPRDILSMYVTKELYRRNWMYHKKLKNWFTYEGQDNAKLKFFDTSAWELKTYSGMSNQELVADFMPIAEINVDQGPSQNTGQQQGGGVAPGPPVKPSK
jgi:hypothetical protein